MKKKFIRDAVKRGVKTKTWKVMRLSVLFLFLFLSQVWAGAGYSQQTKLTLKMNNARIIDVLDQIEEKSEFYFLFNQKLLDVERKVDVDVNEKTIDNILAGIFKGTNVSYSVKDRLIILSTEKTESANEMKFVQQRTVSGMVTDEEGQLLPGVTVVVKGTTQGTITDDNGRFSLSGVPENATLVFSFVGMHTEEVEVGSRTTIDVQLETEAIGIEEVVAVGYGTMRKRDLTGSVVRADIEKFREMPNVNISQSLQGTVPGLNIGAVDQAGENPDISIRGATTINGNQDVLIVLDGIIYSGTLSSINPADIASIDVLKDPSSMAIYGAQAANGVIIMTSKTGKKYGKPVFNYNGSYTVQNPANELTPMNREQYLQKLADNHWEEAYLAPDYTTPNPEFDILDLPLFPPIREGLENGTEFNWWDNATNPGYINNHNISVSGSTEGFTYFVSTGFTDQEGYIINDEFQRITGRINFSFDILKWLQIGTQTFGSFSDYSGDSPSLGSIATMAPIVEPYDAEGNVIIGPNGDITRNPYIPTFSDDFDKRNILFGNSYLDLDVPFVKGLNYRMNFGNKYNWNRQYQSSLYSGSTTAGEASKRNTSNYEWTLDHILGYKRIVAKDHSFGLTLVAGQREVKFEQTNANGTGYNNLRLSYNNLGLGTVQLISSGAWDESYLYQTARFNYDYKQKYLLTATIRRDGFSGFAENEKIGTFPSVGLAWVLSEEKFLQNEALDNLKLRVSYGENGNLVNRYASLAVMQTYPAYIFGDGGSPLFGQRVSELGNPNLGWESTVGFNVGADFAFWNTRLSGSVDYYTTTTKNLIFDVAIPSLSGFEQITTNVGEVANEGLEINLNSRIIEQGKFSWIFEGNFATNSNEIVSLIGLDADNDGQEDDLVASGLFIGESINAIYGYESDGKYQVGDTDIPAGFSVGLERIIDQQPDGFIDPLDRVIRGREEPAYRFGILNEFKYGNFTLRVFLNSIQGGKDGYRQNNRPAIGNQEAQDRANLWAEVDYWTPLNPDARYQALNKTAATTYFYLGNRSFVRLQDVSLSYTVPKNVVNQIGIRNAKVYVSGKNLATWTKWQGWDPETGAGLSGGRPLLQGFTLGVDLSF